MSVEYSDTLWRNKLHTIICGHLKIINEHFSDTNLHDTEYKENYIERITNRVKYAFEKCAQKSVTESNDNCAEKKQLTGYNQMFAHLYRVEVMTKCYLCTLKTTLNDEFKNEFVCDTKEIVTDSFDLFVADLKFNTKSVDKIVSKVGNKRANDTDSNTPTKRAKTSGTVTSPIDMSTLEDDFLDTRSNMSSPDSVEHAHDIVEHEEHASDTEYTNNAMTQNPPKPTEEESHHTASKIAKLLREIASAMANRQSSNTTISQSVTSEFSSQSSSLEAVLEEKSSHQTSKQSSIDHSEPEEFANENHQFTEDQNEQDEKYIIKMIMPYVPGENIKNMFANLLDLLDAPRRGFVNIARSHSKRAIVIECNSERVKQHFRKQESEKTIYASHLTDSVSYYNMPSSINIPIQFEY